MFESIPYFSLIRVDPFDAPSTLSGDFVGFVKFSASHSIILSYNY